MQETAEEHLVEDVVQQVLAAGLGILLEVHKQANDGIPHTAQLQAVPLNTVHLQQQSSGRVVELLCPSPQHHLLSTRHASCHRLSVAAAAAADMEVSCSSSSSRHGSVGALTCPAYVLSTSCQAQDSLPVTIHPLQQQQQRGCWVIDMRCPSTPNHLSSARLACCGRLLHAAAAVAAAALLVVKAAQYIQTKMQAPCLTSCLTSCHDSGQASTWRQRARSAGTMQRAQV